MNLNYETRTYHIIGLTPILGSSPASKDIRTKFVISKAPTQEAQTDEEAIMRDLDEKGLTIFHTDALDRMCIMDYQVKGFLKQAMKTAKTQLNVSQPASKIDRLVFIEPRFIPLMRNGKPIMEEDDILERPLRAQTMQGERVTLASSEMILDPWEATFEVTLLPNSATKTSSAITFDTVETAFQYGMFNGLGQWRNASYGKFRFERIE